MSQRIRAVFNVKGYYPTWYYKRCWVYICHIGTVVTNTLLVTTVPLYWACPVCLKLHLQMHICDIPQYCQNVTKERFLQLSLNWKHRSEGLYFLTTLKRNKGVISLSQLWTFCSLFLFSLLCGWHAVKSETRKQSTKETIMHFIQGWRRSMLNICCIASKVFPLPLLEK